MMSMTADVCDLDELRTGKRREGVLGAVYWWMVKLGFGIAALLSGTILSIVGFDAENVTESAVTGMRAFYSLLPIAGVIGAVLIMKNYDITEERAEQLKAELAKKRAAKTNTIVNRTEHVVPEREIMSLTGQEVNGLNQSELKAQCEQFLDAKMHVFSAPTKAPKSR